MMNATNTTTHEVPLLICTTLDSTGALILQIISYICICLFALAGNLLIVVNFISSSDRTIIDALVTNIAVSDLLVPLVIVTRELHDALTHSKAWAIQGEAGEALCKLMSFLGDVGSSVSVISLCIITIERFIILVVADSFQIRRDTRNKRLNLILIGISWIIPMGFSSHYFFTFKLVYISPTVGSICTGPIFNDNLYYYIYNVTLCVLFIFIPFVILTTLNIAMVVKLRKLFKELSNASSQEYRRRLKIQKHVKNMVISIIVVFGLCWGPYFFMLSLFTFYWDFRAPHSCHFHTVRYIAVFLTRANAAINPWIYLFFQRLKKRVRFRVLLQSFPLRSRQRVVPQQNNNSNNNNNNNNV